jgi:hypothetical protein
LTNYIYLYPIFVFEIKNGKLYYVRKCAKKPGTEGVIFRPLARWKKRAPIPRFPASPGLSLAVAEDEVAYPGYTGFSVFRDSISYV